LNGKELNRLSRVEVSLRNRREFEEDKMASFAQDNLNEKVVSLLNCKKNKRSRLVGSVKSIKHSSFLEYTSTCLHRLSVATPPSSSLCSDDKLSSLIS